jgi:hypothetical protein
MKSPPFFASCYLLTARGYPHFLQIKKSGEAANASPLFVWSENFKLSTFDF